jgi:hypothetical protein
MTRAEPGKSYLVVGCTRCNKAFRVVDAAIEDVRPLIEGPQRLTCRGCGHQDVYPVHAMRPAYFVDPAGT